MPTPSEALPRLLEVTNFSTNTTPSHKNVFFHLGFQKKKKKCNLFFFFFFGFLWFWAAGDCVLMRPSDTGKPPYVARIEKIEADNRNNIKVRVRWYYRPEESIGGRRQFHGAKELFLSDHYDVQSAHTIEGKCTVHSFKNYTKLENVGAEDYYCRFEYKAATGGFTPDRVAV